jgi:hypothetical protein
VWLLALLEIFLIAVFAYVDASYLRSEKAYRALCKAVGGSQRMVPLFTLDPTDAHEPQRGDTPGVARWKALRDKYIPPREVWTSWSIAAVLQCDVAPRRRSSLHGSVHYRKSTDATAARTGDDHDCCDYGAGVVARACTGSTRDAARASARSTRVAGTCARPTGVPPR